MPAPSERCPGSRAQAAARRCQASSCGGSTLARSTGSRPGSRAGRCSSRRRTGRRRRPRWSRRSSRRRFGSRTTAPGANLVSGIASALLDARRRRARALRGGRGARFPSCAPDPAARGLPREPLPRPARPLRRARAVAERWRARGRARSRSTRLVVVNADDPQVGASPRERDGARRLRRRRSALRRAAAPARGGLEVLHPLRHALRVRRRLRRPPRRLPLSRVRARAAAARRRRPRDRARRARGRRASTS